MPGVWVFPGGAVEPGERPDVCAARELEEETGISLGEGPELVAWTRWITPEVVPVRFDTLFFVGLARRTRRHSRTAARSTPPPGTAPRTPSPRIGPARSSSSSRP